MHFKVSVSRSIRLITVFKTEISRKLKKKDRKPNKVSSLSVKVLYFYAYLFSYNIQTGDKRLCQSDIGG